MTKKKQRGRCCACFRGGAEDVVLTNISVTDKMSELSCKVLGDSDGARCSIYTPKDALYGAKLTDKTLCDTFQNGLDATGDGNFLGTYSPQGYSWISYNQANQIRKEMGSALIHRGLSKGDMVGISSMNTQEWTLLGLSCDSQSLILVPLYDTLGEEGVKFILNQTELTVLFAHPKTIDNYLNYLPETSSIKLVVKLPGASGDSPITAEEKEIGKKQDVELITWSDLLQEGKDNLVDLNLPQPDDICTLCYTSGTTGFPKGAILSHNNIVVASEAIMTQLGDSRLRQTDVHISYLPASHIFERLVQVSMMSVGGAIGYWEGDVKRLAINMQALRPSVFPAVPRILNRLYDKVQAEVSLSKLKSAVFNYALSSKLKGVATGAVTRSSIWDYLVFKKIQNMLGGNIRLMATGAAPLKSDILQFFRAALGATVFEGYGQTECSGTCTLTHYCDHSTGHVGGVLNSNIIKLVDVGDMNYYAKDNKGEICIKGLNVFKGYYKNEEKTKEAVDEDGWLHTGDIGEWTPDGALKIIDRKKNIFKLSQGEYIAPEKIELFYDRSPLVGQVMIYGNSLKSTLVAIIVPDELSVMSWAKEKGIKGTFDEICKKEQLYDEITKQVNEKGREGGLKSFELAKKIHLTTELFSAENNLATPTMKLKRHNIAKYYENQIDEMYKNLD